jgi:hypothetical protein
MEHNELFREPQIFSDSDDSVARYRFNDLDRAIKLNPTLHVLISLGESGLAHQLHLDEPVVYPATARADAKRLSNYATGKDPADTEFDAETGEYIYEHPQIKSIITAIRASRGSFKQEVPKRIAIPNPELEVMKSRLAYLKILLYSNRVIEWQSSQQSLQQNDATINAVEPTAIAN